MADAVTSQKIVDTDKKLVYKFTNISDGSGEASVEKIDVSGLNTNSEGDTCSRITLTQIWYDLGGMRVAIEWNATSNVVALVLGGSAAAGVENGHFDFREFGGISNNAGSGINGDVDLTTHGHTAHDHYTIVAEFIKSY
jgi:hypothetical protein|tara:strand:- start:1345 stop:1761 length:417 start_codon:yes stop_codon:yes gene_type:complete